MLDKVDQINQDYIGKAQDTIQTMQQEVEQPFNRNYVQLDQSVKEQYNCMQILPFQLSSDIAEHNIYKHQFQNDHFQKQINQEVTSFQTTMQNQIQNTQHQYNETHLQQINNQLSIQQPSTLHFTPFTYQLIQHNTIKQEEYCFAIAVNKDCSTLVTGCNSKIKVFELNQGILKQLQLLNEHTSYVYTLNFLKRSDQFISGSYDKLIIIWTRNQNNSWVCQQKLIGHTSQINCLIINDNEDLIISGSYDKTIKFWQKQNLWLCSQTITDHNSYIWGLSINESQNKVISSGDDKLILIIEQSEQTKQWTIIQKITVEIFGVRLCFIDNNTFIFQPWGKDYVHIFEMNSTNKQYVKKRIFLQKVVQIICTFLNNIQNQNVSLCIKMLQM